MLATVFGVTIVGDKRRKDVYYVHKESSHKQPHFGEIKIFMRDNKIKVN